MSDKKCLQTGDRVANAEKLPTNLQLALNTHNEPHESSESTLSPLGVPSLLQIICDLFPSRKKPVALSAVVQLNFIHPRRKFLLENENVCDFCRFYVGRFGSKQ
jgi:hypothetical protein